MEYIKAAGDESIQCFTLEGGVKGWVKAGPQCTRLMDGYKEEHWNELFAQENAEKTEAGTNATNTQNTIAGAGAGDVGQ